jgi:hypothetical protein
LEEHYFFSVYDPANWSFNGGGKWSINDKKRKQAFSNEWLKKSSSGNGLMRREINGFRNRRCLHIRYFFRVFLSGLGILQESVAIRLTTHTTITQENSGIHSMTTFFHM